MNEWVVLELGPMAEGEDPALIRASIRGMIRDAEVFVPASVTQIGEDRMVTYLVDGYAFIKRAHPDEKYFRLEGTRYVQAVVRDTRTRGRRAACVTDRDIDKFRRQVRAHSDQGIDVGDTVTINSGPYKNLTAVVVEDVPEQDSVQVRIELRSKDSLVTLPRSFLHLQNKVSLPPYLLKAREAREWFDITAPVLRWEPKSSEPLREKYSQYQRLDRWLTNGKSFQAEIRLQEAGTHLADMRRACTNFSNLSKWLRRGSQIQGFIRSFDTHLEVESLLESRSRWERLHAWDRQLTDLTRKVEDASRSLLHPALTQAIQRFDDIRSFLLRFLDVERAVRSIERRKMGGTMVVENLVIDGLNMAVRCSMAPGLSDLRDAKGRPTGAIVGFLNSLAALRKKHPQAEIWVCWDSPSTRRKELYPEYKANRNPLRATFEVLWLKEVLPAFGVWQASAEGEEADDVIASLVCGKLDGQQNVIVSNDRDFMQLVTETTQVLVPAVGIGKEKLCTPELVQAEYGVTPEKMVHFRALGGDTSDNIPGAPGCGNKTAGKLLQLYGTVDGIFVSNLAGLSQSLREKLRLAEKQVRLNLLLMSLSTDLSLQLSSPNSDQSVASELLDDIGMNKTRVISVFFNEAAEALS